MRVTKDMHVHTNLSACADPDATLAKMAEAADRFDIQTLASQIISGITEYQAPLDGMPRRMSNTS